MRVKRCRKSVGVAQQQEVPPAPVVLWARCSGRFLPGLTIWLLASAALFAQSADGNTSTVQTPLWSFAWISDMHLDESRQELAARALHHIDEKLKPHFVLITGDNNARPAAPVAPNQPESLGLRRQRFLKAFFEEHLKSPYVILPGDNWPEDFDKVFGAKQYSFDYGGLHFLILDVDRSFHGAGAEGLSVFDDSTWAWLRQDLDHHAETPTIVAIHEPVVPCTFLDAGRLRQLLDRHPQVIAALQGHLHADLEFRDRRRTYLVAPSLGKSPTPAFRCVDVYPDKLIVRTVQCAKSDSQFRMAAGGRRIEIGESYRQGLTRPAGSRLMMGGYDAVPPHPHCNDPALAGRVKELVEVIKNSIGKDMWSWR